MAWRYRDTKTGKLVNASTWFRSRAQGGTRFVRERIPEPEDTDFVIDDLDEWEEAIDDAEEYEQEKEAQGNADSP